MYNFTDDDDEEGEKRLVGLRQAAPQAKIKPIQIRIRLLLHDLFLHYPL